MSSAELLFVTPMGIPNAQVDLSALALLL